MRSNMMPEKRRPTYHSKPPLSNINEAMRKCLFCGVDFISEWLGNRICKRCKQLSEYRTR
jgi:hypothetical protein